jgi:hypothetical protein
MQEREGRYWFNPMPSIIEIVQDEARRASLVEARERLVNALKKLAESPPSGASKKEAEKEAAPQLFSVVEVRDEPLPVDEPKYSLVIVPRVPSDNELRELVFSTAGGRARVYRNTVAVLYPRSEERLNRLLDLCRELAACDAVAKRIEELYAAEDMRELQRRKLNQYKRERETQLYSEIISAYDGIAFPADDDLGKSTVSPRATSLARVAEMALESPDVGKAYISKLDFETLNHLLKQVGVDLSEGGRELSVKEVLSYIFTNPRLPFIKRDLVLEALKEGVRLLRIGVLRGGEVYFARVYEPGEIAAVPEGRPPGSLDEPDIVLPWRIAAEKLLDRLKPEVGEQLDGRRLRVYYVLVVEGQELELQGIPREKAVEMLKAYPIVRKSEEVVLGVDVVVEPSYVEERPGSRIEVKVSVEPIGKVEQPVELSVDAGEIEPRKGTPPFTAVWRLEAPGDEGRYAYEVRAVSASGRPVARQLTVSVQRERVTLVCGFEVSDLLECENLAKLFPGAILEEGEARLAAGGQEVSVSGRGLAPDVFVELVKEAMSLTGVRSARFNARLRLPKPREPAEVDRLTAGFRSVRIVLCSGEVV